MSSIRKITITEIQQVAKEILEADRLIPEQGY